MTRLDRVIGWQGWILGVVSFGVVVLLLALGLVLSHGLVVIVGPPQPHRCLPTGLKRRLRCLVSPIRTRNVCSC